MIYKLQSLLPETCGICKESYTIQKNDPKFLSCSVCKQEVHRACYMPLLKTGDKTLGESILKIPGMHYLCPACEYDLIPDDNIGLKKKKNTVIDESQNISDERPHTINDNDTKSPTPSKDKSENPPDKIESISQMKKSPPLYPIVVVQNEPAKKESVEKHQSIKQSSEDIKKSTKEEPKSTKKNDKKLLTAQTCVHYKKNQCKHGISGKGCQYSHPKRCTKLMNHGTRANKGCNLGAKCKDFHPKMCQMSISKSECFDVSCQLCHVKGTRRKPLTKEKEEKTEGKSVQNLPFNPNNDSCHMKNMKDRAPKMEEQQRGKSQQSLDKPTSVPSDNDALQQSFLAQISLLKKELQEVMDKKVASLMNWQQQITATYPLIPQHQMLPLQTYPQPPIPWLNQLHQFQRMQQVPQIPPMGY